MLPQRLTPVRAPSGQQQGPGRALPEAGGEERRPADLSGHQVVDLVRVQHQELGQLLVQFLGVGEFRQPQHDAVVGGHCLHIGAVPLPHPRSDAQGPGGVHRGAERAVQHDPPVADLVAEPLDDQGAVIGHLAGGLLLLGDVIDQVAHGILIQPLIAQPASTGLRGRRDLPHQGAHGSAQLSRAPQRVTFPERKFAQLAGGRGDQHLVMGDVLDPPGRGAQREHITDSGLVDHLLVQLAHPPTGAVPGGQHHRIQPPVRDGAAAEHGQVLSAASRGEPVLDPVPDDPRAQVGEVLAGVAPGQHVQGGLEQAAGHGSKRGAPTDQVIERADVPLVHGDHRHDLLGQHVQRVGRHPLGLDPTGAHLLHHDGALQQVTTVLGEQHPPGDRADLVPGPTDAL